MYMYIYIYIYEYTLRARSVFPPKPFGTLPGVPTLQLSSAKHLVEGAGPTEPYTLAEASIMLGVPMSSQGLAKRWRALWDLCFGSCGTGY